MTSIEWLIKEIEEQKLIKLDKLSTILFNKNFATRYELIVEQAKEMHKQEIINTWYNGYINQSPMIDEENSGEQFYQETFVSKGSDDTPMERKLLKSGFVDIVPKQENHIVDTNEMVEDNVEKLAVEEYPISKGGSMWMPTSFDLDQSCRQEGFIKGYNKAKETLYTEEQVREAYFKGATDVHDKCTDRTWRGVETKVDIELLKKLNAEYIQSLKQPKKD